MPKTCTSCGTTYPDTMVFCPTDGTSLRLDEAEGDLIGTVIADRYLVNKLLGEGGMGKVYLARHVRLPQQAAIKVLHHDMVKDAGAVVRFKREAANAASIEHDRVARVFDYGETSDGSVFIAMEFVPGRTLRGLLDDARRLPPVRAANVVYQVAEGLDAAHRLSIVHRDLKPDNIMVITDEGGADRCKVVDFGIAKVTNGSETQLTQMGMLVGTPEFMSPEQVLGEQLDGRSDVYALALVAYEMFTGELPFEGNTPERKLTARLIQDPKPFADVAPDVEWPEALQAAFDRALVREPESRTATAMEFADEVVNAIEAWTGVSVLRSRTPMSTTAIMSAAGESTSAMQRPTPTSVAAPASTAAAPRPATPTAAPRVATPGAGTSASKPAIPEPAPKKSPIAAIAAGVVVLAAVGGYLVFGRSSGAASAKPEATAASAPAGAPSNATVPAAAVTDNAVRPTTNPSASSPPAANATKPIAAANNTAPTGGGAGAPPVTPPASGVPAPAVAMNAADAAASRRELMSIRTAMLAAPDDENVSMGTKSIPQLKQLLPRLGTATDSAWAYIALVTAYGMAERSDQACEPFRNAKRLAATDEQRLNVEGLTKLLTCAP